MAAKTLKYAYLSSWVSFKDKLGIDLDTFNVKESTHRSGNGL